MSFFKAGNQSPIGHRSAEPRNKRSLCDRTSSDSDRMADKRKKGGCAVSSVESRGMSEEGDSTEITSTATDWFEHSDLVITAFPVCSQVDDILNTEGLRLCLLIIFNILFIMSGTVLFLFFHILPHTSLSLSLSLSLFSLSLSVYIYIYIYIYIVVGQFFYLIPYFTEL